MALSKSDPSGLALEEGQTLSRRGARSVKSTSSSPVLAIVQVQFPSHRKCLLCLRYDDDWDPVSSTDEDKKYMRWGKPPNKTGHTVGNYCFYCLKYYTGRLRPIPGMTFQKYQEELGGSQDKLNQHMKKVDMLITKIKEHGGNVQCHFDFDAIDNEASEILNRLETVVNKPGYQEMPTWFYNKRYGDLETNGMRAEGHFEKTLQDGSTIMVVPDDPITHVQYKECQGVERRSCQSLSGPHSPIPIASRHSPIAKP